MSNFEKSYWDNYYTKATSAPVIPSQFAVFFAQEADPSLSIVEIGCGNGRDSLFFASIGRSVLGIDGSKSSCEVCTTQAKERGYANVAFMSADVADPQLRSQILERVSGPLAIYARFFIHAITEDEEKSFFKTAQGLDDLKLVALEFRTNRDEMQSKVTPSHYRRFVSPLDLLANAQAFGFSPSYFTEGFGFAKYRHDDAHVARVLLKRSRG